MRATLHIIVLAVFCWGMGVGVVCGSRTSDNPVVVYYMPYNKIVFDVEYEEVELVRGKYYEFAKQYLGVSDVCTRNSRYYVLRGVTSRIETTPDYSRLYSISSKIRSRGGVMLELLSLSEAGILLGYNVPMVGRSASGVREGSELRERVVEGGERGVDGVGRGVSREVCGRRGEGVSRELYGRVGEVVRRGLYGSGVSLSGSLCGEGKIGLGLLSEESVREVTLRMRAKMLAEEIYRIREMKLYIMSGEGERVGLDRGGLEYVMGELELAERGMIKEFTGEERRRVVRRTLRWMIKEFTGLDSSFGAGGRAETLQEREPENTVKYKRTPRDTKRPHLASEERETENSEYNGRYQRTPKTSEAPLPLAPSPEEGETLASPANFGLMPEEPNKEIADMRSMGMLRYYFGLTPEKHDKEIADLQRTKLRNIGMLRYHFQRNIGMLHYHIFCRKSINKTHSYGKHETHRIL